MLLYFAIRLKSGRIASCYEKPEAMRHGGVLYHCPANRTSEIFRSDRTIADDRNDVMNERNA